ncbi:unnamed protein product [Eruca vesicaria subsp. sativa]|uniref:Phytocyanin domain-containing protein n=1 Tax=Eruca vesicaria subsp. sativa TaxID=29727 RepID=A0ABC8LZ47_ERUVS|nr:unnamed protein product [Eruca vesicaria subsp. sativa]
MACSQKLRPTYMTSNFTINTQAPRTTHSSKELLGISLSFGEMGLVMRFDAYLMIVILMGLEYAIGLSNGYKFNVGGRDGWILASSEDYSHWSHRNRFQVNDTLYFKYAKGKDSVLEVSEEEYNTCNTTNPITSLGESLFVLSRSGSFFFISGDSEKCLKGQKLAVKVMSTIHHSHSPRQPSPSLLSIRLCCLQGLLHRIGFF